MKRWNLKSFVLGALAAALVMCVVIPAMAATVKTTELYYNDIKIRLNGEIIVPKDGNGKPVEPFIIDGTTYLPLRAIASALGLNVDWDGATQTVILGNDPQNNQPAAWLNDLDTFEGSVLKHTVTNQQYDGRSTANNGDTFERYWYSNSTDGTISYLLNGKYARLTGTFYLSSIGKNSSTGWRVLIYCDDNLVYTSPEVAQGVQPVDFNIDVSNCYKLTIVSQYKYYDNWVNKYLNASDCYIGNAALWTN